MDALATYQQRLGFTRRLFTLHSDRIVVHTRRLGSDAEAAYDLTALHSHFDRAQVRTPVFFGGCFMFIAAVVCFISLIWNHGLVLPAVSVVGGIGFVGLVCLIFRVKPLRVFMFKNRDGVFVFEIVGAGRDAHRLDEFVSAVSQQIQKARNDA
jgi:hypothetical protein